MDAIASGGGVGAVVSQVSFRVARSTPLAPSREPVVRADIGSNALKLIQAIVANVSASGHDLDIKG